MKTAIIDVLDVGTHLVCLAVELDPGDDRIRFCGWGSRAVLLVGNLRGGHPDGIATDPYDWPASTMFHAHRFIEENWDEIPPSGAVVRVDRSGGHEDPVVSFVTAEVAR